MQRMADRFAAVGLTGCSILPYALLYSCDFFATIAGKWDAHRWSGLMIGRYRAPLPF